MAPLSEKTRALVNAYTRERAEDNPFSNFRSAIQWEWPDRTEAAEDTMQPIGKPAADIATSIMATINIRSNCDSPIEWQLGGELRDVIRRLNYSLEVVPQYKIERYRYDFGVADDQGRLLALVECDGKTFHSTEEQITNDARKSALAASLGVPLFRFTGSEIARSRQECARRILSQIGVCLSDDDGRMRTVGRISEA